MPSTIPYDPSLVLGNLVSLEKLDNLVQISSIQANADAAEDELNSLISLKRSIDMTIQEMADMGIDASDIIKTASEVGDKIKEAATAYAKAKIDSETKIQPLKAKIRSVSDSVESPIDYNKSQIKKMPLSADSFKMNCQYFAYDENEQSSSTQAATVSAFVREELSYFGNSFSSQAKVSAQSQMNSQHSRHSIAGTLVISVSCTHKDAVLLAPLILDVDKAIRAWNAIYPDNKINVLDPASVAKIMAQANSKQEKSMTILSGATYGSCFIGMVHVLNTTETQSSETMYSVAESLQAQMSVGGWFGYNTGFGVDSSFSNDAKNLLSQQNISSHCTLIVMGSIPSIKSNSVTMAVKGFTDDDPAKSMAALSQLQNATASDMDTIDSSATAARTGQQMVSMKTAQVKGLLSGLSDIDNNNNKIIDTNSLMDALEDYVNKCLQGNIGIPINYYLKPITKSQLAQMYIQKYYPSKFTKGSGDDSTPDNTTGGGGNTTQ